MSSSLACKGGWEGFLESNSTRIDYYLQIDYQSSLVAVYNSNGTLNKQFSYDPWGRRRSLANWSDYTVTSETLFTQGNKGHEHLNKVGLINMNGRLYDPLNGRMLSPDNFVQSPNNSQSFNRYSYCLNNPMKYTDPSGELFIIDDWVIGFVKGFTRSIGGKHEDGHHTWFGDAWGSANRHAGNSAKIWGGLFAADTKQSGWGWQIVSRFTWELPQTIGGFLGAHGTNMIGQVNEVDYWGGATTVQTQGQWGGITLGSYIIGDEDLEASPYNRLFQHEYGHVLQSRASGWAYIPRFGLPSLFDKHNGIKYSDHDKNPVELDANARALLFFTKNVDGFTYDDWNYTYNPFFDSNGNRLYATDMSTGFLNGQLLIPTYIQELIINHVRNSTRNRYYSGY
jgi:RHS repeat-associated protein